MMHWGNLGGFGLGWIFMILLWAMVILGIIYFVKQLSGRGQTMDRKESAEDILKKRYASGEITREEFKEKLAIVLK